MGMALRVMASSVPTGAPGESAPLLTLAFRASWACSAFWHRRAIGLRVTSSLGTYPIHSEGLLHTPQQISDRRAIINHLIHPS